MEELRLPWNNKEGLLYGGVIALITSLIMCEFNLFKNAGEVNLDLFMNGIISLPLVWIVVMLLITLVVGRIANAFVKKYTEPTDSFYTKIVFNIIACVLMMSASMTLIGPTIGHTLAGDLSMDIVYAWPSCWPVNFCVAFWVEMLVAQPTARCIMKRKHIRMLKGATKEETGA